MTCRACWREVEACAVYPVGNLELCPGCYEWLRRLAPMGADGSEGYRLVGHFMRVWSASESWARRTRDLARREAAARAGLVEA